MRQLVEQRHLGQPSYHGGQSRSEATCATICDLPTPHAPQICKGTRSVISAWSASKSSEGFMDGPLECLLEARRDGNTPSLKDQLRTTPARNSDSLESMFIKDDKLPDDVLRETYSETPYALCCSGAWLRVRVDQQYKSPLGVRSMYCLSMTVRNTATSWQATGRCRMDRERGGVALIAEQGKE